MTILMDVKVREFSCYSHLSCFPFLASAACSSPKNVFSCTWLRLRVFMAFSDFLFICCLTFVCCDSPDVLTSALVWCRLASYASFGSSRTHSQTSPSEEQCVTRKKNVCVESQGRS